MSRRRHSGRQRGMTLLEIIIVLAIIGMAMVLGTMAVRHVRKTSLREDSTQVMAVMRAAREMAMVTGMNHRVVFDLDKQVYRIEQCPGDMTLAKVDAEERPEEQASADMAEAAEAAQNLGIPPELVANMDPEMAKKVASALAAQPLADGGGPGSVCGLTVLPNGDFDGRGNERAMNTEDDIKVRRMVVQHLNKPAVDGVVTIHFFAFGNAEKSMVVIGDDDGNYYTVLVHPFTGRIEMRKGEVDEDDFMRRDGAGDKVEER